MELREILLKYSFDREKLVNFLKQFDLLLEDDVEYSIVIEEQDKIIATGSASKNILKCIAIDEEYQGLGLTNKIVSKLIESQNNKGYFHFFIFTKPQNKKQMLGLGFKELIYIGDKLSLLDSDTTNIDKFTDFIFQKMKDKIEKDSTGLYKGKTLDSLNISTIVMNANPFTKGHKHLVDYAVKRSDLVIIFVVKEDKSKISFKARFECVNEAFKGNEQVMVFDGGEYIISNLTFPTYFLKEKGIINDTFSKLDATIFAKYIAKNLKIKTRFLGEEPLDVVTKNYNDNIKEILNDYGINVEVIPRKKIGDEVISASFFRKLLAEGKYDEAKELVPETTFEVLKKYGYIKI